MNCDVIVRAIFSEADDGDEDADEDGEEDDEEDDEGANPPAGRALLWSGRGCLSLFCFPATIFALESRLRARRRNRGDYRRKWVGDDRGRHGRREAGLRGQDRRERRQSARPRETLALRNSYLCEWTGAKRPGTSSTRRPVAPSGDVADEAPELPQAGRRWASEACSYNCTKRGVGLAAPVTPPLRKPTACGCVDRPCE